ncbi:protein kinase domain-containing protein [Rhodococcus sp. JS3073]|uniref:protein kinase domain-containing protein n=1 Tax=Rhodococcus sp. JS3073 TaxID=3002901 RepID=UPI002286BF92|nr:protein kinase [Rhodococcus sp. JS3073]WAM19020.1 protein kinase [Rhodococcus sp. JS3073]
MTEADPVRTQREDAPQVPAELTAAGFDDAHEIGRGGFGIVYRCVQAELDRTVAVKVLTAELDDENKARFLREQRAMGRLTGHPNIVNVLQIGATASGRPYIVMPYHPQDSLETRIRGVGPLTVDEALRLGVKMAGALETAHRLGVVHRDVKPANILFTDYGEPALTDFGIAHISGGFETGTGTVTGSPAFTAPEVLKGQPPSPASDIYGLGATLFCAITGHAAFERHNGEQVIAQFLRITTQPLPDLRKQGLPDDVCSVIEMGMSTQPADRSPSAAEFGDALRQVQRGHGFRVDEMALHTVAGAAEPGATGTHPRTAEGAGSTPPPVRGKAGNLPLELTSFVGRRRELSEAKQMLPDSRLVTFTGIGGVGKTRLALRVAREARRAFADGVWLIEFGELRSAALVADTVAVALGLRVQSARPLHEVLVEYLGPSRLLLVLDNCEHLVDAVAALAETLLRACPGLRILATSREPLGIGGEAALRVPPLAVPDPDHQHPLRGLPRYDAVTLFLERAKAAVPGFELTDDNRIAVARICHRLDGLPLPIELAAARLRALSAEQILDHLTDRYRLLSVGSRGAPTRQQTLRLSIDWSYDLCTPQEQQVWCRLSVFAGSFELDAAEYLCAENLTPADLLDVVASLVDKSILIREEPDRVVRYRLLETLRDYGREKVRETGEHSTLRLRHRDWYEQLASQAEREWIGSRQLEWIGRLHREQPNLREALEFCLAPERGEADAEAGLRIANTLYPFWLARGLLSEGRRWFDRVLAAQNGQPTPELTKALYTNGVLAGMQGDLQAAATAMDQAQQIAERLGAPAIGVVAEYSAGLLALYSGDLHGAVTHNEAALRARDTNGDLFRQVGSLIGLALALGLLGDSTRAIECHDRVLAITEHRGESLHRGRSHWAYGLAQWQEDKPSPATTALEQGLRLSRLADDPVGSARCMQALAWIAASGNRAERAAVLTGAADVLWQQMGVPAITFTKMQIYQDNCVHRAHNVLGDKAFELAFQHGNTLSFDAAVAYALGEQPARSPSPTGAATSLTRRERQVADLVGEGLTNKAIAARLVISQRTAQGHVEHVLAKLGFTSRTQIAAWVVQQAQSPQD